MSEFKTFVCAPAESMKKFNARLADACQNAPITSFEGAVVDGRICLTLLSELEEATAEDVADSKGSGSDLKVGDLIPVQDPICVQVSGASAVGDGAANTEQVQEALNERADGAVTEVRYFSGEYVQWVLDRNETNDKGEPLIAGKPKYVLVQTPVVYIAVAYYLDEEPASS